MKKIVLVFVAMLFVASLVSCKKGGSADKNAELKIFVSQPRLNDIYQKYAQMFVEKYNTDNNTSISILVLLSF
ncbi:MAG: hypothetical protein PF637_12455 [Spirochaetes bacterium]|nr:hypothetical protein [Spirochaetota bacterium]